MPKLIDLISIFDCLHTFELKVADGLIMTSAICISNDGNSNLCSIEKLTCPYSSTGIRSDEHGRTDAEHSFEAETWIATDDDDRKWRKMMAKALLFLRTHPAEWAETQSLGKLNFRDRPSKLLQEA